MNELKNALSIEKSAEGRRGVTFETGAQSASAYVPAQFTRSSAPKLPQLSEFDTVRHFTNLSRQNYCLDSHFYPLGSCTMKYNPKAYDALSALGGFTAAHPFAPEEAVQGTLEMMYHLQELLKEVTGLAAFTLQPAAGAHGELTGILAAKAYHESRKDFKRTEVIVPDTAHGTNPATSAMVGLSVKNIASGADGCVDKAALAGALSDKTAIVMLTVPNTAGLFEKEIAAVVEMVHAAGALVYMDGANFNALLGVAKPGMFGIDLLHLNLHKTFAAPHGGGGPGAGPVGANEKMAPFLPKPVVELKNGKYTLNEKMPKSLGKVKAFYGNVAVLLRAYAYLRQHDGKNLHEIAENAVLNANYIRVLLQDKFPAFFNALCMHECVLTIQKEKMNGIRTADIAKRLLDYGFYAPTIYFPLIVPEAIMIEPTETESKESLDRFACAMGKIFDEAVTQPELVHDAPHNQPVARIDEVSAAREPNLHW